MSGGGASVAGGATGLAALVLALSTWLGDPAVLAAVASLVTAIAAFSRARHHRIEDAAQPSAIDDRRAVAAETALHEAERTIRTELLRQLDHLRLHTERLQHELAQLQYRANGLERSVMRCSMTRCPVRDSW